MLNFVLVFFDLVIELKVLGLINPDLFGISIHGYLPVSVLQ
jgi:hypothetical protein